jgi:hypothetical protein
MCFLEFLIQTLRMVSQRFSDTRKRNNEPNTTSETPQYAPGHDQLLGHMCLGPDEQPDHQR